MRLGICLTAVLAVILLVATWAVWKGPANRPASLASARSAETEAPRTPVRPVEVAEPRRVSRHLAPPQSPAEAQAQGNPLPLCDPERICGVVLNDDGEPLAGALCELYPSTEAQDLWFAEGETTPSCDPLVAGVTGPEGRFALDASEGVWVLEVSCVGRRPFREERARPGSYWTVLMNRGRTLDLYVVDTDDRPIEQARALLIPNLYAPRSTAAEEARTDAAGWTSIPLHDGECWYVEVSHSAFRTRWFFVPTSRDLLVERRLQLERGLRLSGTVEGGDPGSEATILVSTASSDETRRFTTRGRSFETGPVFGPEDQVEVTARCDGYAEARAVVDLASAPREADTVLVVLKLSSEDAVAVGRVVTRSGEPVLEADVFFKPIGEGSYFEGDRMVAAAVRWRPVGPTDREGRFRIEGLMAHQPYQLLVAPRSTHANALARVPQLEPGVVHDLGDITVECGVTLYGRATTPEGLPVRRLRVSAVKQTEVTFAELRDPDYFPTQYGGRRDTFTNQEGRFELDLLHAGASYDIYWADGTSERFHDIGTFAAPKTGSQGPIEVVVDEAAASERRSMRGVVTDIAGAPLGSVLVEVFGGPESEVIGEDFLGGEMTDAEGGFSIESLPDLEAYRVTATDLRGRFAKNEHLVPREDVEGALSIVLEIRSAEGGAPIDGVVWTEDASPLSGAHVSLFLSPLLVRCDCLAWETTTDESGQFSFGEVTAGDHQVAVVDRSGQYGSRMVEAAAGARVSVVLSRR